MLLASVLSYAQGSDGTFNHYFRDEWKMATGHFKKYF